MSLDPQVRAYLAAVAAAGLPPLHTLTPAEGREELIARRRLTAAPPPPIRRVEERRLPGPAGALGLRIYTPVEAGGGGGPGALPVLVFFHGGGWVVGSLDTHDGLCRRLANAAGCLVVSVDYRLAPEDKFPAAVDDAYAATRLVATRASSFGGDGTRLAVGGDSAGGNPHVLPERADHRRHRAHRPGRPPGFDPEAYKRRNVVERCVNRLKQCRALATATRRPPPPTTPSSPSPPSRSGCHDDPSDRP
jgi:hypothetical protein